MNTKRLFIAISLPDTTKEALTSFVESYQKLPSLTNSRWVAFDTLHITALFLGDVLEENIPPIQKKLETVLEKLQPFVLTFEKITFAPSERRPHMIWARFKKSENFVTLVAMLQLELSEFAPLLDDDLREPIPHVTLARLKNFSGKERLQFPPLALHSLHVKTCLLCESELTNKGPIYSTLGSYSLCKSTPS